MLTLDQVIFVFHFFNNKLNLHFTGTAVGSCHLITGIAIYYFIIWDLFLVEAWEYETFVK